MKILIIDSHKGSLHEPQNLHWSNAKQIQLALQAAGHAVDLIWSYPTVNDAPDKSGYDCILFNHASHYSYVDYAWLEANPNSKLFYFTNEYNLGEPRALWMGIKKAGRSYSVIANHHAGISKIVKKYTDAWHFLNLNSLVFSPAAVEPEPLRQGCVYYGSFRADRVSSFKKFLSEGSVVISTHSKNRDKFRAAGVSGPFVDRLNWKTGALSNFCTSLYIEDDITHQNYNCLANRFYEAISHGVLPIFDSACRRTVEQSGYAVPECLIVNGPKEIPAQLTAEILPEWRAQAAREKIQVLHQIVQIISQ